MDTKTSFYLDDGSLDIVVAATTLICIVRFAIAMSSTIDDDNALPRTVGNAAIRVLINARRIVVR
jgi:hypothetical protein